jgi:hypothetical protein
MSGDASPFGFTVRQRPLEAIVYSIATTEWGSSPSSVTMTLSDVTDPEPVDVSADCLSGTATVSGNVILLPAVKDLVKEHLYWLECEFDAEHEVLDDEGVSLGLVTAHLACYLQIQCVR